MGRHQYACTLSSTESNNSSAARNHFTESGPLFEEITALVYRGAISCQDNRITPWNNFEHRTIIVLDLAQHRRYSFGEASRQTKWWWLTFQRYRSRNSSFCAASKDIRSVVPHLAFPQTLNIAGKKGSSTNTNVHCSILNGISYRLLPKVTKTWNHTSFSP